MDFRDHSNKMYRALAITNFCFYHGKQQELSTNTFNDLLNADNGKIIFENRIEPSVSLQKT